MSRQRPLVGPMLPRGIRIASATAWYSARPARTVTVRRSSSWQRVGSRRKARQTRRSLSARTASSSGAGWVLSRFSATSSLNGTGWTRRPYGWSCFASRGGDQPGGQRARIAQLLQLAEQSEPHGLHDVLGDLAVQPVRARDVPDERRQLVDEFRHRPPVTAPRRLHAGSVQVDAGQAFPWRVYLGGLHVGHRICLAREARCVRRRCRGSVSGAFSGKEQAGRVGIHRVTYSGSGPVWWASVDLVAVLWIGGSRSGSRWSGYPRAGLVGRSSVARFR